MTTTTLAPAGVNLSPASTQRIFRSILDALARPGRTEQLPPIPDVPSALLPVLALADLDTAVCVLGRPAGPDWVDLIGLVTSAPTASLARARFVTALRPMLPGELRAVSAGSSVAPEDGALVSLAVPDLVGTDCWVRGPGVPERLPVTVPLSSEQLAARAEAVAGYPAGIDLLLITPDHRLLGLPRTLTIEER